MDREIFSHVPTLAWTPLRLRSKLNCKEWNLRYLNDKINLSDEINLLKYLEEIHLCHSKIVEGTINPHPLNFNM